MLPLITTRIKDNLLKWLCQNVRVEQITDVDFDELEQLTGLDADTLEGVLIGFKDMGLISEIQWRGDYMSLKMKAHDLYRNGGFVITDALTEANIQKLLYELDHLKQQLKPNQLETFNKVASIVSAIATVYTTFVPPSPPTTH
ncbi:hypothetical protein GCM10028806_16100 [Spirosoma terrae]|uniref:Uncharacterized protein n=1 Tax=Spirosoma terrae TaxID=1968276 RepID=A0A6L9LA30_9BACT|nr:hypothetical protein [Spirosoma terrae]NDU95258.1 hypothetical protein [Spirosoma terrae]